MATHSSILAWRIPGTEEPGRLPVHGVAKIQTRLSNFTSLHSRIAGGFLKKKKQLSIQKTKIMASGPITSWEIDGETVETVADFIFLGSKINADGDCSHEIKKTLTPWKESYDQYR